MLIELATACKAVCSRCADGHMPFRNGLRDWIHGMDEIGTGTYATPELCAAGKLCELADREALQGRRVVADAGLRGEMEEVATLPNGATLYREENGAGGHSYWSDAISGGVLILDTCLHDDATLLAAMAEEHRRRFAEQRAKREAEHG